MTTFTPPARSKVRAIWESPWSFIVRFARAHPGIVFLLLWFVATFIGALLYAFPVGLVQIALGLDSVPPEQYLELGAARLVLAGVLCGAGYGLTIGLAQWLVLRRRIKQTGWWVPATMAGYASVGLLSLLAGLFQPGWLPWALTLVISGKMYWLARVAVPTPDIGWQHASWPAGAVTLLLFGAVLGLAQWLVLRGRVPHAGWWVAVSIASFALLAVLSTSAVSWENFVTGSWTVPVLVSAIGLAWLVRGTPTAPARNVE